MENWDKPWMFRDLMKEAYQRCHCVAESERLLGYTETCKMYNEIADEFRYLDLWVEHQLMRQLPAA